ncbi:tetratricopeptide repeat protein [Pontibacter sp. G13]|uniref:tetratricopeptide repeat protein n=1 Tax=Pontibacter sp. G13 TaxID=3074898 RepID=UPI0028895094|nr:tetratricopeptide repeat protein [Pontibacter sp. G13]WNJ18421.1 tetratricopeptide repeat protein [Pontibacter sp. G13]
MMIGWILPSSSSAQELSQPLDSLLDEISSFSGNGHAKEALVQLDSIRKILLPAPDSEEDWKFKKAYGVVYMDQGDMDAAKSQMLPLYRANWKQMPQHIRGQMARAVNDLGLLYFRIGKMDSARAMHDHSLLMYQSVGDDKGISMNYGNIAVILSDIGRRDSAIYFCKKSLQIARENDNLESAGFALLNLGLYEIAEGTYAEAIRHLLESREYFKQMDRHDLIYRIDLRIAQFYLKIEDFEGARPYIMRGKEYADSVGIDAHLCRSYRNLGDYFEGIGDYEAALVAFDSVEVVARRMSHAKLVSIGVTSQAMVLRGMEQYRRSIDLYMKGIEEMGDLFPGMRVHAWTGIGKCQMALANYRAALNAAEEGERIARQAQIYESHRFDLIGLKVRAHRGMGQYKLAFDYLDQYQGIQDSTLTGADQREIARQEYEFQKIYEQRIYDLEREQSEVKHQHEMDRARITRNSIIGVTLLLFGALFFVYLSYERKKRDNRLLALRAEQLRYKHRQLEEAHEKEQALLNDYISEKDRRIAAITMTQMEFGNQLKKISDTIGKIQPATSKCGEAITQVQRMLKAGIKDENQWDSFVHQFDQVHPRFFDVLRNSYPGLTVNDQKICAYIKIGMDNKSIASVTDLTLNTVKSRIYRLKKKMGLEPDDSIREVVLSMN